MVGVMYLKPAREVAKDSTYQTLYVQTDEAGRPQAYFLCVNIPSVEMHGLQCS